MTRDQATLTDGPGPALKTKTLLSSHDPRLGSREVILNLCILTRAQRGAGRGGAGPTLAADTSKNYT